MFTKPLYISKAAPGKGKTESLINNLSELIKGTCKTLIAAPTTQLGNDLENRIKLSTKIDNKVKDRTLLISHETSNGVPVGNILDEKLKNTFHEVVICTHAGLTILNTTLLTDWTVVIDEVPRGIKYWNTTLSEAEQARLWQYVEVVDSQLRIKADQKTALKERLTIYRSTDNDSTLSKVENELYSPLLNGVSIYVDEPDKNGKRGFRYFRIYEEFNEIIRNAKATHLLCANFSGTEFEGLCNYWNIPREKSFLSPANSEYTTSHRVTIYPLIGTPDGHKGENEPRLSRYLSDKTLSDGKLYKKPPNDRDSCVFIDHLRNKAIGHIGRENNALLVKNKLRKFERNTILDITEISLDSRGMNNFIEQTNCIILFSNNPNPLHKKSFEDLEQVTGISSNEWYDRYLLSHTYEMALQGATRTNIRVDERSSLPVNIYVPDWHHARYLRRTLPNAQIDTSLLENPEHARKENDKRSTDLEVEAAVVQYYKDKPDLKLQEIAELVNTNIDAAIFGKAISRQNVSKILNKNGLKRIRSYRRTGT